MNKASKLQALKVVELKELLKIHNIKNRSKLTKKDDMINALLSVSKLQIKVKEDKDAIIEGLKKDIKNCEEKLKKINKNLQSISQHVFMTLFPNEEYYEEGKMSYSKKDVLKLCDGVILGIKRIDGTLLVYYREQNNKNEPEIIAMFKGKDNNEEYIGNYVSWHHTKYQNTQGYHSDPEFNHYVKLFKKKL